MNTIFIRNSHLLRTKYLALGLFLIVVFVYFLYYKLPIYNRSEIDSLQTKTLHTYDTDSHRSSHYHLEDVILHDNHDQPRSKHKINDLSLQLPNQRTKRRFSVTKEQNEHPSSYKIDKVVSKNKPLSSFLTYKNENFFLKNKKLQIFSGSIHYFRVVPEYWKDRLLKMRAAGLNTITTYVPWNLHEEIKGKFKFQGILDIRKFLKLTQSLGFYVILRPGPYICSEWDFGGLPGWLLHDPQMKVRSLYPPFISAVKAYFVEVFKQVSDFQIEKGGNIIAMQVENEFGSIIKPNPKYLLKIKELMQESGATTLLLVSDGKDENALKRGSIPGVVSGINFKRQKVGKILSDYLKKKHPDRPILAMELWTGWFDNWGGNHAFFKMEVFQRVMSWLLKESMSFNFYMFHGGTNFGFMNGALAKPYRSQVTSYDYLAPISENGELTAMYHYIKRLLLPLLSAKQRSELPQLPAPIKPRRYPSVKLTSCLNFFDLIGSIKPILSEKLLFMEELDINNGGGQTQGYIVYRKVIQTNGNLELLSLQDYAQVFVNKKLVASSMKDFSLQEVKITSKKHRNNENLTILVENAGHVNFATSLERFNSQRKGISGVKLNGELVSATKKSLWQIFPLEFKSKDVERYLLVNKWTNKCTTHNPNLFQAKFMISGSPSDTFIDTRYWGKGIIFINGFNIGRYFSRGPQKTLYVPAPLLKSGSNQIVVFDLVSTISHVTFTDQPILK